MKNFTNNFKQFTSRLSARWLIMALMLLVGTSSAWGAYYVTGNVIGNWNEGAGNRREMTSHESDVVKAEVSQGGDFKIHYAATGWDDNWYKTIKKGLSTGATITGNDNGSNLNLALESGYSFPVTIYFDPSGDDGNPYVWAIATVGSSGGDELNRIVAGTPTSVFGTEWDPENEDNKMTKISDGVYRIDYYTNFQENTNISFKVTDGSWSNAWPGDNKTHTIDKGCQKTTITYKTNGNSVDVITIPSNHCCSAPSGVSITGTPTTNPCPGTEVTLTANVDAGDADSYSWSVSGTDWSIMNNTNTNQNCTFIAGTETGNISLTVSGCNSDSNASASIQVKSRATKANLTVTDNVYTYDGTAKAATVKWNDNQSTEGINITYEPASPIDAGSYDIKVTTSEHGDLCASNAAITLTEKLTITQATQTGFEINNTTLNICGTSVVVTSTGGQCGDVTYSIQTDNTTTNDATINNTTGELNVNSAGTVIVTATKAATTNYEEATNSKEFTFIMLPNVALKETSISVCSNEEINLSEYVKEESGTIKWYSDSEYNTEIAELTFTPNTQTYYVKATNGVCEPATASLSIKVIAKPTIPTFDTVDPRCDSYTLPTEDKNRLPIKWYETMESVTPLSDNTTITATGTYYAEGVNGNCVSEDRAQYTVTVNPTPTITGKSVTQPNTEITLTSIQGVTWSVSPTENVTLTDNGDGTATFSASVIGEFVVSAQKENCSTEYTITVTDKGNIIYVRRPKSEDGNNYTYWYNSAFMGEEYYGTQNYIKNGADFSTASENNKKGTAPTVPAAFTDCDGYVWDRFEVLGYESFFVHAPVQTGFGGYSTFTQTIDVALEQPEMYVTIGTWVSGLGAPITKVEAPSLVKVYASGETTLGANKFAALYVTDCSGREIDTYQWEYRSTEDETYTNYIASVSNSGTLYSGDAGTTNNIRPSVAGFYRCTVTYIGGGTATSAAKEVTGTYSYLESNIPVIVVNTNGVGFPDCPSTGGTASLNADVLKEKRSVDVKIYNGTTLVYDRKARMNYRGSSSLNFQKKSYAFCPGKDNCVEDKGRQDYVKTEKMNMLNVGTAKDKDWVLYASAADPTLMRNRLVFDTYQAMRPNDWGVHSRYVELIVDGEHKGVYVLMDKITKNDNRVKLNEDNGFIVKFDKTDCADRFGGYNNIWGDEKTFKTTYTGYDYVSTYDTHIDQRFEIEYPEKDDYTIGWSSKVKSIQAMFQAFEDALKTGDYATVQKYIDYDSWADWFIINEYTKNVDAYRASCIFVYTGEDGAKIEARPLWDQELSFNNQCPNYMSGYGSNDATGFLIQKDKVYEQTEKHIAAPFWFTGGGTDITGGLLSDPCFVQIVKEKWSKYSTGSGPLTEDVLKAKIDAYTTELGEAKNREADYWELHSRSTLSCPWDDNTTGYNNTLVTTSLSAMYTWFANRGTGLTTAINGLTGTSFSIQIVPTDQEVTPWIPAEIAISVEPEGYDYTLEYTGENKLGDIANAIIEKEDNKITYRIPRPDAWETGNAEEGTRADFVYGIKATLNVAEGNMECGSQAAPSSIASITLQDEENDECE